jgi:hypothetical protein
MKTIIEGDAVQVVHESENPVVPGDPKRQIPDTPAGPALTRWSCSDAEQAEKHLATWTDPQRGAVISKGDASMLRDMANERRKQRES